MKILGITDERTVCECCGKVNLKCTVAIELEADGIVYYGRDCAARKLYGRTSQANANKITAAAESVVRHARMAREQKLARIATTFHDAHMRYIKTGRSFENTYTAYRGVHVVRVDASDAADMAFYEAEGFVTR